MNPYALWETIRFFKRFIAYFILFPLLAVLYPVLLVGDWLGSAYYHCKEW